MNGTTVKGLTERYGRAEFPLRSMAAELAKKNAERRMMHERLTEAGIPEKMGDEAICLIGRLEIALARSEPAPDKVLSDPCRCILACCRSREAHAHT